MRRKFGAILMLLGCLLIVGSLTLFVKNQQEQARAAAASEAAIPKVVEAIRQRKRDQLDLRAEETSTQQNPSAQPVKEMPVVQIDGDGYIGFVGIPSLELELPVMADWSYPQLQKAPCRYSGSMYTDDMVLMAHNYDKHFGRLNKLKLGDIITFTDMDAQTKEYKVVAKDILDPEAVAEMTAGDFDLTLFTCTYGGENRVTIRCDEVIAP